MHASAFCPVRIVVAMLALAATAQAALAQCTTARPRDLVYLRDVEPGIVQDIRYAGWHNFIGRKIAGYDAAECIITEKAAKALQAVHQSLQRQGFALKVYDCYRPDRAVADFAAWANGSPGDSKMKDEFYPRLRKNQLFALGYIAKRSGHSRGSTVDLTIVPLQAPAPTDPSPSGPLKSCTAADRFADTSIDMGTGYDCMDELSHTANPSIADPARKNRRLLVAEMSKAGFANYYREWWHFSLSDAPYAGQCFDFPITPRPQ